MSELEWTEALEKLYGSQSVSGGRDGDERKQTAAFFTLPETAVFLAELALGRMDDVDWSDRDQVANLKAIDPACGDGALLLATLAGVIRRAGLESARAFAQKNLMGIDIHFQSIELAKDRIAEMVPGVDREALSVWVFPYGTQPDGSVRLGALELLGADFMGGPRQEELL